MRNWFSVDTDKKLSDVTAREWLMVSCFLGILVLSFKLLEFLDNGSSSSFDQKIHIKDPIRPPGELPGGPLPIRATPSAASAKVVEPVPKR